MYKLFGNVAGMKLLDVSKEELDILDTMTTYINGGSPIDFRVEHESNGRTDSYKYIENANQYNMYSHDVEGRQKVKTKNIQK